mmetsp:Transcript_19021/g.19151  ORF Transcript_19021/g.19151 Transcript_19021/m.19151 type:complete len:84 (-) Transcript_19021:1045-1296(-)
MIRSSRTPSTSHIFECGWIGRAGETPEAGQGTEVTVAPEAGIALAAAGDLRADLVLGPPVLDPLALLLDPGLDPLDLGLGLHL